MDEPKTENKGSYDISIVRPPMSNEDFRIRGRDMAPERLKAIHKGLPINLVASVNRASGC